LTYYLHFVHLDHIPKVFKDMDLAKKTALFPDLTDERSNHEIYEVHRSQDPSCLEPEEKEEYLRDACISRRVYNRALYRTVQHTTEFQWMSLFVSFPPLMQNQAREVYLTLVATHGNIESTEASEAVRDTIGDDAANGNIGVAMHASKRTSQGMDLGAGTALSIGSGGGTNDVVAVGVMMENPMMDNFMAEEPVVGALVGDVEGAGTGGEESSNAWHHVHPHAMGNDGDGDDTFEFGNPMGDMSDLAKPADQPKNPTGAKASAPAGRESRLTLKTKPRHDSNNQESDEAPARRVGMAVSAPTFDRRWHSASALQSKKGPRTPKNPHSMKL
jgi:hypothetical protein